MDGPPAVSYTTSQTFAKPLSWTPNTVIASPGGVTAISRGTFAPVAAATALPGARLLAGGDGAPVLAVGAARACLVDPAVVACAAPAPKFAVTGAGVVRADSSVVLANGAAGTLVRYVRKGDRLVPAKVSASLVPAENPGLWSVMLANDGAIDADVPRRVRLDAGCTLADGANGFRLVAGAPLALASTGGRLRPQERRVIGWARCTDPQRQLDVAS